MLQCNPETIRLLDAYLSKCLMNTNSWKQECYCRNFLNSLLRARTSMGQLCFPWLHTSWNPRPRAATLVVQLGYIFKSSYHENMANIFPAIINGTIANVKFELMETKKVSQIEVKNDNLQEGKENNYYRKDRKWKKLCFYAIDDFCLKVY